MSESEEIQMISVKKEHAQYIIDNLQTAGNRGLFSRAEVEVAETQANKIIAAAREQAEDDEFTFEKQTIRDLLELLEHCTQRRPPFSRWDLENIGTVLETYKGQM